MKRILTILMMVLLAFSAFAEGQQEEEKPLTFAIVQDIKSTQALAPVFSGWLYKDNIIPNFEAATGIKVELRAYSDAIDNTAKDLDMDLASAEPSDVILSYSGRINRFANADFGIDLYEALPKELIDQFSPTALGQFVRDGKLYALPLPGWAVCLMVNVDLFKEAGVADVLPADDDLDRSWTIAEFDKAVKAITALSDEHYGYYIIAKECGGDYWVMNMLGGFGAKLYENGKVALNTPEGIAGMKYIHYLHENGYAPYGASGLYDGDMNGLYNSGKLGIRGSVPAGVLIGEAAFAEGKTDKPFKSVIMEYPHVEGIVDGVGPCMGADAAMVIDNGDPVQLAKAVKFLEYLAGPEMQSLMQNVFTKFSPLKTAELPALPGVDPRISMAVIQMSHTIKERGIFDMGLGFPVYNELRQVWLSIFQGMLANMISPEEAVAEFERRGNKLLSE